MTLSQLDFEKQMYFKDNKFYVCQCSNRSEKIFDILFLEPAVLKGNLSVIYQ